MREKYIDNIYKGRTASPKMAVWEMDINTPRKGRLVEHFGRKFLRDQTKKHGRSLVGQALHSNLVDSFKMPIQGVLDKSSGIEKALGQVLNRAGSVGTARAVTTEETESGAKEDRPIAKFTVEEGRDPSNAGHFGSYRHLLAKRYAAKVGEAVGGMNTKTLLKFAGKLGPIGIMAAVGMSIMKMGAKDGKVTKDFTKNVLQSELEKQAKRVAVGFTSKTHADTLVNLAKNGFHLVPGVSRQVVNVWELDDDLSALRKMQGHLQELESIGQQTQQTRHLQGGVQPTRAWYFTKQVKKYTDALQGFGQTYLIHFAMYLDHQGMTWISDQYVKGSYENLCRRMEKAANDFGHSLPDQEQINLLQRKAQQEKAAKANKKSRAQRQEEAMNADEKNIMG